MKVIISLILILIMMVSNFFGSFNTVPEDLGSAGNEVEIELSVAEKALLTTVFETETAWLASLQLENGAIPMTYAKNGVVAVNPYFADFAALALLDNQEKYVDKVKAYMDWHFSHLNTADTDYNRVDGTIYDYSVTLENGKIVKEEITVKDGKKSYDSTDSYAATFRMVLNKYYEKTGDTDYIIENGDDIVRVAEAMFSTINMGLTYAKPDYKVMYLMDNCEVYEGVKCAEKLLKIISEKDDAYALTCTKFSYASEWIKDTIENKLWNSEEKHYEAGIFADGSAISDFTWDEFYPSATSQMFPIIHGVIPADSIRAGALYNSFCEEYNWQEFDIPDSFCWGSNAYAAAVMGDTDSVITYMEYYVAKCMLTHAYPLYNADAAKVAMAAYLLLNAE